MSSDSQSNSHAEVDLILADLKHLDLTGSVYYDTSRWPVAQGGFGDIYKGCYKQLDGTAIDVAVKRLKIYLDGSRNVTTIFRREISAWSKPKHPNVLPLLGYTLEETGDQLPRLPCLVSPWMENGNVLEFVNRNPSCDVPTLVLGMADGLAYLHEEGIIHCDFKSANVLVSPAGEAVINDFGSAHGSFSQQSSTFSGTRGTSRWLAYELLITGESDPKPTKASDTWAFGMTLYEIMTNSLPFAEIGLDVHVILAIMKQKLPSPPAALGNGYKKQLWDICSQCWNFEPAQRPTMADLAHQIKEISRFSHTEIFSYINNVQPNTISSDWQTIHKIEMNQILTGLAHFGLTGPVYFDNEHPVTGGGFSDIFRGSMKLQGGSSVSVAIKRLRIFNQAISMQIFKREIMAWSRLNHPNVLQFRGYILKETSDSTPWLPSFVSEWMENGTVLDYIKNNQNCNTVKLALGMAEGLAYMHQEDIIHCDFKSNKENVLVSSTGEALICDFSNAYYGGQASTVTGIRGTVRWLAHELIANSNPTKATDIWAFGMTLYELLSRNMPYAHLHRETQVILAIMQGELPHRPASFNEWPHSRKLLWDICQSCWNKDPKARPTMDDIVKQLESIITLQPILDRQS